MADAVGIVHLVRYEDRETYDVHCEASNDWPVARDPAEATCVACLESARYAAEREAEACADRLDAIRASEPMPPQGEPRPLPPLVADENVPPGRAYIITEPKVH